MNMKADRIIKKNSSPPEIAIIHEKRNKFEL